MQILIGEGNLFNGQSSDNGTNDPDFSRHPVVTVHISGDSPISDDAHHRTQNQVRYNLEEGETTLMKQVQYDILILFFLSGFLNH